MGHPSAWRIAASVTSEARENEEGGRLACGKLAAFASALCRGANGAATLCAVISLSRWIGDAPGRLPRSVGRRAAFRAFADGRCAPVAAGAPQPRGRGALVAVVVACSAEASCWPGRRRRSEAPGRRSGRTGRGGSTGRSLRYRPFSSTRQKLRDLTPPRPRHCDGSHGEHRLVALRRSSSPCLGMRIPAVGHQDKPDSRLRMAAAAR